ncbi:unnamed protein product [Clonostachys chloroleuca]|uniref:ABC transporter domain-containing protein n=1 Tax=Clonostachys chloroleuca TaxID=1926264 RepID=A0AA35MC71_9HYPO|nr:unnamed protein product [Clonostachys chloroleuca]
MPSYLLHQRNEPRDGSHPTEHDLNQHVFVTAEAEDTVTELHRVISKQTKHAEPDTSTTPAFEDFEKYLRSTQENAETQAKKPQPVPLSVCFKSITTYGRQGGPKSVKTLKDAIWRTLTLQDIYEATLKRLIFPDRVENGQALIRDFSGVVRNGQMMLVLGNPGSGCSTFLRTIGGEHDSFLGVNGSIDYSGLSLEEVSKYYRGAVAYVPEDDVHLPTLTVRQTLEFALKNKTPKKLLPEVPRFLDEFGRVFGMNHVMNTLVGNEFVRGVSGGERKRVSILESLASDSSVNCWDGSTRGLDASSALDYIRSLRIMTDTCDRATIVSIYQASDAIYDLMDKILLIDQGRMLYQGPAKEAEGYFEALGYRRLPRQTMSDFLANVAAGNPENIQDNKQLSIPRGAVNLEQAFRSSEAFQNVQNEITEYEHSISSANGSNDSTITAVEAFKHYGDRQKSRFVSPRSSYNTSFIRQAVLCTKREYWQLMGDKIPFLTRFLCIFFCAWLLGSMFYQMPLDTRGVYSRGGFSFYCAATVAWFQMAELETAFFDRTVVSRQRRYAMVRPSAVVLGKTLLDFGTVSFQSFAFSIIAYFMSGMRLEAGPFFAFSFAIFFCAMAYVSLYRLLGAASPRLEISLRYCGILLLIAMVFGGYMRSVDRLISDVPWVGWLSYTTPVLYAFEIIMAAEFHSREFNCASTSIIPSGQGYNDAAYQTCSYESMSPGEMSLQGDTYILNKFGFSFGNIGRDFGILILFMVAFVAINMWVVEKIDWAAGGGGALEFAHGPPASNNSAIQKDEESTSQNETPVRVETLTEKTNSDKLGEGGLVKSQSVFTWRNLNYTVSHKDGEKQLLSDVSGFCEPGKMTALVGASGAGKSTLMTVLTQQATGRLEGNMKINDKNVGSSFGRSIGYCQQMDIHVETSTVREAFEFSALLRQSGSTSKKEKLEYVDEILDILQMKDLQDVIIRSLSLEQKKRTTIGVELCAKPSMLLFLDEPTSGLDGQGAMNIVRLLRRLADHGQAIICTIHQANQEQFELFDRVLALNHGGRVYYFGDIGPHGKTVVDYFTKRGVGVEADKNIADLLIEVTARNSTSSSGNDWCDIWDESPEAAAVLEKIDNITSKPQTGCEEKELEPVQNYASSTLCQIFLLTKRTMVQYWRTPDYVYSRLYCSFFHAFLNGLAFLQLGNTVSDLQYRVFTCFLVLMIVPEFINACAVMFDENRNIWLGREHPSRIYGWVAFTTAQVVSEIPYAFAGAVLFYVLFYFLIGLPLGAPAGYTFLMMMMFHLFSTSWGQWIAAADAVMAASVMPFFIVVCEFFNGILQPVELMPVIWRYTLYYIGPFTYWVSGTISMILLPVSVKCADSEFIHFHVPPNTTCGAYAESWLSSTTGYLADPDATDTCNYCQYTGGQDYLSNINVSASDAWPYLGIFALFTVTNYLSVYLWVYIKSVKNWLPW